ncbi:MAG: hypothetical protein ACJAZN_003564 [Planctomycetota bacterium]|jgi:uncharacterized protein (DUF1800 family)
MRTKNRSPKGTPRASTRLPSLMAAAGCWALLAGLATGMEPSAELGEGPVLSGDASASSDEVQLPWGAREVEHVWNRAGFGIRPGNIGRWVKAGPEALVDHLLAPRPVRGQELSPPYVYRGPRIDPVEYAQRTIDERREYRSAIIKTYALEFARLRADWVRRMVLGEDPLRDRLTLFWHGVFTTSYENVREPDNIARQHQTLRRGALGSYGNLLRSMLRDPAMLSYLNNDQNTKGKPNENLAREVMELFSLGEGSGYTEADVQEAARALTGAGVVRDGEEATYRFRDSQHDDGAKSILGVKGNHGPQDLATILLGRPECAEFIAGSLIEYMEGVYPEPARLAAYAGRLRATDYDTAHFVRTLLLDPAFYRPEVVGARIASPIDYVVGANLRLAGRVPVKFLVESASSLGQDLFQPPNVKGWEEGIAWVSTASFMLRGNVAGAMLGRVHGKALRADTQQLMESMSEDPAMAEMSADEMMAMGKAQAKRDQMSRLTRILRDAKFKPRKSLYKWLRDRGDLSDAAIVEALAERLLAIEPPTETLFMLEGRLKSLRKAADQEAAGFLGRTAKSEPVLRQLSHLILSLPEAQLH